VRDCVGDGVCGANRRNQHMYVFIIGSTAMLRPRVETNHDSQPTRHKLWVELHDGTLGGLGL